MGARPGFLFLLMGVLSTVVLIFGADPAAGDCLGHDRAIIPAGETSLSSPCIHKRREGVIVPLKPANTVPSLLSVNVDAEATFFSCRTRNFTVNVAATFQVAGVPEGGPSANLAVAMPITTHSLYGDHNQFREVAVFVDNVRIRYSVAIDRSVYETAGDELRCKGRLINHAVHPLLAGAEDLRVVAPDLVAKGFDMVIYWWMDLSGYRSRLARVEYTSNSNDFSDCCKEVAACTYGSDPHYFYFDLSNARFWPGQTQCRVALHDSKSAEWSAVPMVKMLTETSPDGIELTSVNNANVLEDLAVPAQPAVFDIWPRIWPPYIIAIYPPPLQPFETHWIGGDMIDQALIETIPATDPIRVHADLPFRLDERTPVARFEAGFKPPVEAPAYIDVVGSGMSGGCPNGLYDVWLRVPLAGKTIMGHDLAITGLHVTAAPNSGQITAVATVVNKGIFTDRLVATLLLDNKYLTSEAFGPVAPGEQRAIELTAPMLNDAARLPRLAEVEIEPIPGEVNRLNNARKAPIVPQPPPLEVLFSIEEPQDPEAGTSFVWPPFGDGDEASDRGYIVADNARLLGRFNPAPTFAEVPFGLDALHELRCNVAATAARPVTLFSVENGFYDTVLGQWISDGDLLSSCGKVVATNAQLLANFGPMPPTPDMGLDAVYIPYWRPTTDSVWPPEIWFSTERGWWDEKLGRQISDGDLLSTRGYVVATNAHLLSRFSPMPPLPDLGLDAVYVPRLRPYQNASRLPEIWFSVEQDFFDEALGVRIFHGDLLSTSGKIVRTNQQLLRNFPNPLMAPISPDIGLDAVDVRARRLIAVYPPGGNLSRSTRGVLRFVFDGPIELSDLPLRVVGVVTDDDISGAFDYSLGTTDVPDDTLVVTERGSALADGGRYTIEPTEGLDVDMFVLEVGKKIGDADGNGLVNAIDLLMMVKSFNRAEADLAYDPACDFNGDGIVNAIDLLMLAKNFGQ